MYAKKFLAILLLVFCGAFSANRVYCQENTLNYYNDPPGTQELNLFGIGKKKEVISIGVISPDKSMLAYSVVYFYPNMGQYASKVFIVKGKLQVKTTDKIAKPILEVGFDSLDKNIFRTLTIIDWSIDSKKLLIKETFGGYLKGIWSENLWVYNFDTGRVKRFDNIKEAIVYYWKYKQKVALPDLRWDIVPLGWSVDNPDMAIVNAYGYGASGKQFLGCWGIDISNDMSKSLSFTRENMPVSKNGFKFEPPKK